MRSSAAIIGAGTAGLIAAKDLAASGIDVTVYDQKKKPGFPAKASGILSVQGASSLGIRFHKAVTNSLNNLIVHAYGESLHIRSKEPKAYVLDRMKLNEICMAEAEALGAQLQLGRRLGGAEIDGLASRKVVVGADGAISEVAMHFGMGSTPPHLNTYKAEFNSNAPECDSAEVFFGECIPKGLFGWMVPLQKDILEIGIGVESHINARDAFGKLIGLQRISDAIRGSKMLSGWGSVIPIKMRPHIADTKKGVLLVGDAAGQVKPSTGGGIVFGASAAKLASEAIKAHISRGEALEKYEHRYRSQFSLDTAAHRLIRQMYSAAGPSGMRATIKLINLLHIDSIISRYGDMDMPTMPLRRLIDKMRLYGNKTC